MIRKWILVAAGALLTMPLANAARTAVPGTINYIEGQVSLEGRTVSTSRAGEAALQANQILDTANGKAEVLLSPGVFMRVGSNSEIRMISPGLSDPHVEVLRGEAMIEVDHKPKEARLLVSERGADASLLKEGLYKFDADEGRVAVIDGKAQVTRGGRTSDDFGKGKEIILANPELKPVKFDRKAEDDLYRWSNVRSEYLAQANAASARTVYVNSGPGWGPGWYWNPYFSTFSWLPGDSYFYSPFGYSFYSPRYVIHAPVIVGRPAFTGGRVIGSRGFGNAGVPLRPYVPAARAGGAVPRFSHGRGQ